MRIYNEAEKVLSIEHQDAVRAAALKAGFAEANITMIVFTDETGKKEKTLLL